MRVADKADEVRDDGVVVGAAAPQRRINDEYWKLDPATPDVTVFLTSLLIDTDLEGETVGAFDGRVTARDTGIAASIIKSNDPAMMAIGGVYTAMWNAYLNDELKFTSTTPFMAQNNRVFPNWNFGHIDPKGAQRGDPTGAQKGRVDSLYTAGDLAAAMELNPYLKVFSANGYYDAVTPFFQTILNFESMPCSKDVRDANLIIRNYESGHMIYLDDKSRSLMKKHLVKFYKFATGREKKRSCGKKRRSHGEIYVHKADRSHPILNNSDAGNLIDLNQDGLDN